jgi:hypothetical protein
VKQFALKGDFYMKWTRIPRVLPAFSAGLLLTLTGLASAQTPTAASNPPMFPFVLPWDDASPGTITDVSFLNAKPAGKNGYIMPKNGHFVEGKTGKRIRFIGTNFAAKDAFPSHADAAKVAARIAKLGINLVRLHHMDNDGWGPGATIWDTRFKDRQHIDPAQLDKLDYLVFQFKKNGIYSNLNLHVSRLFTDADGFPESVNKITFGFDKRVDEFDRRMIQLQKNYAHDLLTHVNPYTHLSYAQDPAIAVVEINNENSLVGDGWAGTYGTDLDTLPEPFRGELVGFWNTWLLKKYGTDAKLQAAWTAGLTPTGPGLLANTSAWSSENQGVSHVTVETARDRRLSLGAPNITAAITQTDGTNWHVQAHQTGLNLTDGTTYTVSFQAKADTARTLPLGASLDQSDWHNIGLTANAALTTDWKPFRFVFTAHDTVPNHARLAFTLGGQTGTVWISDLQIHPGAEGAGLQPGESLTSKTVNIPTESLQTEHTDWIGFLADTERSYAEEMRTYLRKDLQVKANIICSQISWGGLTGVNRETNMDFADNHAYWQHPSFPHVAWDANDWNIPNTPMVSDLAEGKGGTLRELAEYRVGGKPYTISEYNHPAPNDYQAEMMPEFATFAAFQDWDAIYLFDYGDYGAGVSNDQINGYFGVSSNPAKMAFLPAAAMIFRAEGIPVGADATILSLTAAQLRNGTTAQSVWNSAKNAAPSMFDRRFAVQQGGLKTSDAVKAPGLSPLRISGSAKDAQYVVDSAGAASIVGYVGGQTIGMTSGAMTFPAFGNNFAAVTLTPMDQKSLAQSHHLLLTLAGKVENQGMVWNADRTSVGSHWGHGPSVAEGIPATVMLKTDGMRHVWALDGTGHRTQSIPATYSNGSLSFTVGPQFQTLWYEVGE